MKKLILNVITALFISCLAFANTNEIKATSNLEFETIEIVNETKPNSLISEDGFWFCYKVAQYESINQFSGDVTITTVYHCSYWTL